MSDFFERKVLMINCNDEIIEKLKQLMKEKDNRFKLINTPSIKEGFKHLENEDLDAIILDYHNPKIISTDILEEIKEGKRIQIPIIFLINENQKKITLDALKKGANRIINKSEDLEFSSRILLEVLDQEIKIQLKTKELRHYRKRYLKSHNIF